MRNLCLFGSGRSATVAGYNRGLLSEMAVRAGTSGCGAIYEVETPGLSADYAEQYHGSAQDVGDTGLVPSSLPHGSCCAADKHRNKTTQSNAARIIQP